MVKDSTRQHYQQHLNEVYDFIDQNLLNDLSLFEIAEIACLSPYHFERIFTRLADEPVKQYVSRKRLEFSVYLLKYTDQPIASIPQTLGYQSADAYAKAFRKRMAYSPAEYRRRFSIKNQTRQPDAISHEWQHLFSSARVAELPSFDVIYYRSRGFYEGNFNRTALESWRHFLQFCRRKQFVNADTVYYAISPNCMDFTDHEKCLYETAIESVPGFRPEGAFGQRWITGGRHVVFDYSGPYANLHESWQAIFKYYIPFSPYTVRSTQAIERCPNLTDRQRPCAELWVPIH